MWSTEEQGEMNLTCPCSRVWGALFFSWAKITGCCPVRRHSTAYSPHPSRILMVILLTFNVLKGFVCVPRVLLPLINWLHTGIAAVVGAHIEKAIISTTLSFSPSRFLLRQFPLEPPCTMGLYCSRGSHVYAIAYRRRSLSPRIHRYRASISSSIVEVARLTDMGSCLFS